MLITGTPLLETGMYLRDLLTDMQFATRKRVNRNPDVVLIAMKRLARVFAHRPENVLQEIVDIAVDCCGADSAGISKEEASGTRKRFFRWVAISGSFAQYVNGTAPRFFSPCGTCLDSGRAQIFRVTKPYYDYLGVTAEDITDGMLIPWADDNSRGTIWAIAHHSYAAFDPDDYQLLSTLAELAPVALRHQLQQDKFRTRI